MTQTLRLYSDGESDPMVVLSKGPEGVRILRCDPDLRLSAERWARHGALTYQGVVAVHIRPEDSDFLPRLGTYLERQVRGVRAQVVEGEG